MKKVLSIAGSDPSGGAGIQADLKTMEAHGVYSMSVITALTAQNTTGVIGISPVAADFVRLQLRSVFDDIRPDAVKIGMLPDAEVMEAVRDILTEYKPDNIVLDPVISSTSGTELSRSEALAFMKDQLFPICDLITPNIPEAERLSGIVIKDKEDMEKAEIRLCENSGCSVLLKGGHSLFDVDKSKDILYHNGQFTYYEAKRINNPNTHGTGCTLSSAIASNLALGMEMQLAVEKAKQYLTACIEKGLDIGHGRGPLEHRCF